ncbi:uncharacterized protein N7483_005101 [Penicillium malachiteum]|uniref:uncharacterized protein n=1 Tax=Penicillium malachiteum TaxID=1324776 RepID=UPI002547E502|nr:uncharacterized protein N7483_005101 [Penicillium malachiteum]KAJ5730593.1 hypothetical protein N7483_005101 [Penicillium malachiteum]
MDIEKPEIVHRDGVLSPGKIDDGIDLEKIGEREGYVLNDASLAHDRGLKTTADGGDYPDSTAKRFP